MTRMFFTVLMLLLTCTDAMADIIIADSYSDFSGVQGQGNWYYGYYDGPFVPADFEQMTVFASDAWFVDGAPPSPFVWTVLNKNGGHPNGRITSASRDQVEQWAVRRWVSNMTGDITIAGNIADSDGGGGNGVIGRIFHGGDQVYAATIENAGFIGVNYSLTMPVLAGDIIDFAIDPRSSNDLFDSTRFTARITTAPEPSTFTLLSVGAVAFLYFVSLRQKRSATGRTLLMAKMAEEKQSCPVS
jgi:hypothetical protein